MIDLLRPFLNSIQAIVVGLLLYGFGPAARRVVGVLQLNRRGKEWLFKSIPGLQIVAWSVYGVWLIGLLMADRGTPTLIAVGVVAGMIIVAAWFAVRDVIGGAILRTEDVYEPGEWLRVGDAAGRIRRVGARSLEMEMENGRRLRVPYSLLAGAAIVKAEPAGSATAHSFTVSVPHAVSVAEARAHIQRAALLCMWSSTARSPRVETITPTAHGADLSVTVYAVHPDYQLNVEHAVRASLSQTVEEAVEPG